MSTWTQIPLTPISITLDSQEFRAICGWPFTDAYIGRLLRNDIPQRVQFGNGRIWNYRDPEGRLVGFGTIDVCGDCCDFTGGKPHPYIPLLAVNPTIHSLGYGTTIVRHLIAEAALLACQHECHGDLFLDVYTTNVQAIRVYKKCGFVEVTEQPLSDHLEGGKLYIVMATSVSVSSGQAPL